jgi:hypothetical protein
MINKVYLVMTMALTGLVGTQHVFATNERPDSAMDIIVLPQSLIVILLLATTIFEIVMYAPQLAVHTWHL